MPLSRLNTLFGSQNEPNNEFIRLTADRKGGLAGVVPAALAVEASRAQSRASLLLRRAGAVPDQKLQRVLTITLRGSP